MAVQEKRAILAPSSNAQPTTPVDSSATQPAEVTVIDPRHAIDLGVEFGAGVYVFWGGREGTETDASKDPAESLKRFREAINFLCEYVRDRGYNLKFALEAKPNEPRGDLYLATTGGMLGFIETLDHPEMVGVNPEVAHEHMTGLNFLHAIAQAWEAGKLFHIDVDVNPIQQRTRDALLVFGSHSPGAQVQGFKESLK